MNKLEDEIKDICDKSVGQMSFDERMLICKTLQNINCGKLLVFGAGNDSGLLGTISRETFIVEHDVDWLQRMSDEFKDCDGLSFHKALYNTFDDMNSCIDAIVSDDDKLNVVIDDLNPHEHEWDAIIVDAPTGYRTTGELYRGGSIRLAAKLSKSNCHVFVHDVDRVVEQKACDIFFAASNVSNVDRLNHYII